MVKRHDWWWIRKKKNFNSTCLENWWAYLATKTLIYKPTEIPYPKYPLTYLSQKNMGLPHCAWSSCPQTWSSFFLSSLHQSASCRWRAWKRQLCQRGCTWQVPTPASDAPSLPMEAKELNLTWFLYPHDKIILHLFSTPRLVFWNPKAIP